MARLIVDDWDHLERLTGEYIEGQEARLRDTGQVAVFRDGRWKLKPVEVVQPQLCCTPVYAAPVDDEEDEGR